MYLNDDRARFGVILEWITEMAVVAVFGLFIANFLFFPAKNASKSMEPTILQDSVVFSNRLAYIFTEPKRFDVISFRRSEKDEESDVLVRRVVALPGETIRIYRGSVYIDGEELDVSGYFSEITSDGIAEIELRLNADEYFVLGDMPANSEDSRSSTIGPILRKQVIGRAFLYATNFTDLHFIK